MSRLSDRISVTGGALYTQGAHVADWTPAGHRPVLFMSKDNSFEPGKPIRGGVPIIFPWFGPRPEGTHGYARTSIWTLIEQSSAALTLTLTPDLFRLNFHVDFGDALQMELTVHNLSRQPQTMEMALHTYLSISHVDAVRVSGLDATEYLDKTDAFRRKTQSGDIRVTGETDRVYLNTVSACVVHDAGWNRRIEIQKTGSATTVVWNPYAPLPDMKNWRGMICVETANAAENAVTLEPGAAHTMTARLTVAHDS